MQLKKLEGCTILDIGGNMKDPEKAETIIKFPTGEVSITRTTDNNYWVHVHVKKDLVTDKAISEIINARLDIENMSTSQANIGDFNNPGLYHLAVLTKLK
jgi:hypothetical protein